MIVGGGIVGCSTAYHLAHLGWTDTVLLERGQLTCGSTFHAAGLVGQLRSSANITQLLGYSVDLYRRLEAETGQATGWRMNGGLRLACNAERWEEVKRQATTATSFGLEMHLLSPREAADIWPLMEVDDVVGAALLPTDGQASPSDITMALAKGARAAGAAILENTPIVAIDVVDGRVTGVETDRGRIACDVVVLCAGQWTRQLAATIGVHVPLVSVEHQYVITEPMGVPRDLPTLRDPDRLTYYKEEVGGLVMGGYEPNPKPWATRVPDDFTFQLLDADWDHFAPIMELAIGRVPALAEVGINRLINGPESFTPDGMFILGEAPEARELLRRRRVQRLRDRRRGRGGDGARRMDRQRGAALRPLERRHPPFRPAPPQYRVGPAPNARGVRQALHDGVAVRGAHERTADPPFAVVRPAAVAGCLLRGEARMGTPELVR